MERLVLELERLVALESPREDIAVCLRAHQRAGKVLVLDTEHHGRKRIIYPIRPTDVRIFTDACWDSETRGYVVKPHVQLRYILIKNDGWGSPWWAPLLDPRK